MFNEKYNFTCVERFLQYVKIDTQSDENSKTFPSTEKQKDLARLLVQELKEMGIENAEMDEWGYVTATIKSNVNKKIPVIAFISHMDTSPAVSGKNVKPIIHKNYQGGDIKLPNENVIIYENENPDLKELISSDIITADGTTLLGADNKAGVAEIMDAVNYLLTHPEVEHGTIKICFTPDEEVGRGTEKFDVKKFGADYAYTVDGQTRGEVEIETFSADGITITFHGKNIHPGYAKGIMINSIKAASFFINLLPKEFLSPETSENKEGYVHCFSIEGNEEKTVLKFIIRDFETKKLKEYEKLLINNCEETLKYFPGLRFTTERVEQYRNMKEVLNHHPKVYEYAIEAVERIGIKPKLNVIRGGTDGARLSFMGLPTPNIFAGEHSFHSKTEWVAVDDMKLAVKTIVEISKIWAEKS